MVKVIYAKNGYIFELDKILTPKYGEGPTLESLIQTDPVIIEI